MVNKKGLMTVSVLVLLLGGCFNSETGASQRAANAETEAPAKHEVKAEAPAKEVKKEETPAPKVEEAKKVEEPAKAEETKKVEKPAKAEETKKAEEPAKAEETKKVEEPAKAEEAQKAEEPAKAEETKKAEEPAKAETATATPDLGGCKGCHGANFEKKAMGKSKVVAELSKADIATALKGYKAGTYGGAMKALMKGQVASFDDATMDAIAEAIGK
jgi:cytochrome c-type protein NapB